MIDIREDAQTEIKVPAQNGRKAYSYFRNASAAKKSAAGVGAALAVGGLAAAAIAMRKKPEESKALPAPEPAPVSPSPSEPSSAPQKKDLSTKDIAKAYAIKIGVKSAQLGATLAVKKGIGVVAEKVVSEMRKKERDNNYNNLQDKVRERAEEIRKKKEQDFEADLKARTVDVKAIPVENILAEANSLSSSPSSPKPKLEVGGALVPISKPEAATPPPPTRLPYNPPAPKISGGELAVAVSESGKNSGSAIAAPQKTLLTKVSGSAGAALGRLVRKGREGWERDRQAGGISSLPDKEYDMNDLAYKAGQKTRSVAKSAAYKAGQGTRSAAESVANFAQSFYSTFVENKANDVQAEKVKEPSRVQRKLGGVTIKALPQGGKRKPGRPKTKFGPKDFVKPEDKRRDSLYSRIDSFAASLAGR
jgi:hypothetical protein